MVLKEGESIFPGVSDRVAYDQAGGSITNLIDAIVELITNSDDSYLSLEQDGKNLSGVINISIKRTRKGKLNQLIIEDEASGMSSNKIEEIIKYGQQTSEMYSGKTVRGFFGRGLKESIIAIGEGEIISISKGFKTRGKYYYDKKRERLTFDIIEVDSKTGKKDGTQIKMKSLKNIRISCPTFNKLSEQIRNHYALRDILSNSNRKVNLTLEQLGYKKKKINKCRIKYTKPEAQQIERKSLNLNKGLRIAHLKLFEVKDPLEFGRTNPCSEAGILIKTSNAILDNQLFDYSGDPNARYFFGEIKCPEIAKKIISGDRGIVKSDRSGLNWKNKACKELEDEVAKILGHHIERKKKQLEIGKKRTHMPKAREKKFKKLFRKLNKLGRDLIGSDGPGPDLIPSNIKVNSLTIIPAEGVAPPSTKRTFSVYCPYANVSNNPFVEIRLDNPKGKFNISKTKIKLKRHKLIDDLAFGHFSIKGNREKDMTGIIAESNSDEDYAEFTVGPKRKKTKTEKKKGPSTRKGGFFKEIRFDPFNDNPNQRVYYDKRNGIINIYLKYPGIEPYIGPNGEGCDTKLGSMLLSELIAEAFCRVTARRRIENEPIYDREGYIDAYLRWHNEHLKRCIPIIHDIWINI